jgi:hypothetical protein
MIFQAQIARTPASTQSSFQPAPRSLQRKCACGGTPGPTGECEECKRKRLALQPKLVVNQPGDRYEQEADRVADAVVRGATSSRPSISSLGHGSAVQREEPAKPKTEEEKYKEAAKKVGEAFLETPPGKEIKKKAEELGDAFISTLPGKVITGAAVAGAVATLAATHKGLPIGIPEIPLDKIKPGLKMKITYEGPVDKPTKVMATFSFPLGGGKAREKKPALTESEKFRAETARMAAEQAKFREGLKTPEEKAAEEKMLYSYVASRMLRPDQLTPRTSPLSFGVAGEQLGFQPVAPLPGPRSSSGPWVPDFTLSGETRAEEPKKKEEETVQRKASSDRELSTVPPIVDEVLQSAGQPLDPATRVFMEERFGHDFGQVRIHTDARAGESARSVNALAYTVGSHVAFAQGAFAPGSPTGRQLLAHELTHVLQQGAEPGIIQRKINVEDFEAGNFDIGTLETYLATFGPGKIEDHNDSDDKARTIVRLWRKNKIKLDARKKILLIQEMQSGFTGNDDERGILTILFNSPDQELQAIFSAKDGIDPKDLDSDFQGAEEDELRAFYDRKFEGGRDAALKGSRKLKTPTAAEKSKKEEAPPQTAKGPEMCIPNKALTWADFRRAPQQGPFPAATRVNHSLVTEQGQRIIRATFNKQSFVAPRIGDAADAQANGCAQKVSACEDFFEQQTKQGKSGGTVFPEKPAFRCEAANHEDPTSTARSLRECTSKRGPECNRVAKLESDRVLKHERLHFDIGCILARKGTAAVAANPDKADAILKAVKDQDSKLNSDSGQYDTETKHGCDATAQATWETNVQGGLTSVKIR